MVAYRKSYQLQHSEIDNIAIGRLTNVIDHIRRVLTIITYDLRKATIVDTKLRIQKTVL